LSAPNLGSVRTFHIHKARALRRTAAAPHALARGRVDAPRREKTRLANNSARLAARAKRARARSRREQKRVDVVRLPSEREYRKMSSFFERVRQSLGHGGDRARAALTAAAHAVDDTIRRRGLRPLSFEEAVRGRRAESRLRSRSRRVNNATRRYQKRHRHPRSTRSPPPSPPPPVDR